MSLLTLLLLFVGANIYQLLQLLMSKLLLVKEQVPKLACIPIFSLSSIGEIPSVTMLY